MTTFIIARLVDSPVDKVWGFAGDSTKSPGPGITVVVEKNGDPRSHNVGAERTITIGSVRVRERLESNDPTRKTFAYKILAGAPMKNHLTRVEFVPRGSSTEIKWDVEFSSKIPGTGWVVGMVAKKAVNRYIDEVEKALR